MWSQRRSAAQEPGEGSLWKWGTSQRPTREGRKQHQGEQSTVVTRQITEGGSKNRAEGGLPETDHGEGRMRWNLLKDSGPTEVSQPQWVLGPIIEKQASILERFAFLIYLQAAPLQITLTPQICLQWRLNSDNVMLVLWVQITSVGSPQSLSHPPNWKSSLAVLAPDSERQRDLRVRSPTTHSGQRFPALQDHRWCPASAGTLLVTGDPPTTSQGNHPVG